MFTMKSGHLFAAVLIGTLFCFLQPIWGSRYYGRRYVYDKCGQRCSFIGRRLVECTRIRKEFTSMQPWERYRYIRTIKKASTDPKYKAAYDKLITVHRVLFLTGIHDVNYFLTWHRYYILQYENLLRRIDCRFTVSYWDWSLVSANPWRTNFPSPWSVSGMGGNGTGSPPKRCVTTGPFGQGQWNLPTSAGGGCVTRRFLGKTPDAITVEKLLRTPPAEFTDFEFELRTELHDDVHCLIGGTMCTSNAAAAPEFFLHHAMVDKIWADWQIRSPAHKNAYFPTLNGKVIFTPYYPSQLIDLNKQPENVRVLYQNSPAYEKVYGFLRRLPTPLLDKIPRKGFTTLPPEAISLFHIRGYDLRKAQTLGRALQPVAKLHLYKMPTGSTSLEYSIGFRLQKPTSKTAVPYGWPFKTHY